LAPFKPQTTDLILAGALGLVIVFGVVQLATSGGTTTATTEPKTAAIEGDKPKVEAPRLGDKSIAVLPFKNLSPDKDDAYFADGLTEETLNVLAQVSGLKVISRTSSETFKGKDTPLPDIAKALGVRYILEGSVRRDGENVRITAQLIDVPSDTHVWSKTFEPKLERVFEVQGDIAHAIANALDLELKIASGPHGAPTQNMAAYRLWLQANALARSGRAPPGSPEFVDLVKRAIALDPNFAEAHIMLAVSYANRAFVSRIDGREALALVKREVATAERLKPASPYLHLGRGAIADYELRWHAAEQEFLQLRDFDPLRSLGLMGLASTVSRAGKFSDTKRFLAEGQSLDPLNRLYQISTLLLAFDEGDDDQVSTMAHLMTWGGKGTAEYAYYFLAKLAQDKGDHLAAGRQFKAFMTAKGTNHDVVEPVYNALRSPASIPTAIKALRAEEAKDPSFEIETFLFLIDPTNAWIDELNARIASGDTLTVYYRLSNVWRLIAHGDGNNPKVKALMRNAGLVDYWKTHGWPDRCRTKGEDDFECS
jgi:TolB-like protein